MLCSFLHFVIEAHTFRLQRANSEKDFLLPKSLMAMLTTSSITRPTTTSFVLCFFFFLHLLETGPRATIKSKCQRRGNVPQVDPRGRPWRPRSTFYF